ncbi:MAG TPA: hypothetical protein VE954_19210 [Oligoflexus sp.]|uniref:hypothetical protein n=1 Tax=Oligoflexus sp. TaxID=1971216 RepID=UPI002D6F83D8|nr:hypothetical protein [Oligoflexus sp.]HYX35230.1 hypothetical protein [Oligoflexus sp.]
MKKFGLILALSSFVAIGLTGCGQAPSKPTGGITTTNSPVKDANGDGIDDDTGTPIVATDDIPMEASLASFKANLYEPLLKPYCASCHATTFVSGEIDQAHLAFLSRSGFDKYAGIDQTLPVLKMKQAHNCWDGSNKTCIDTMTDKMKLWLGDLEANGYKPKPVVYPNATGDVLMNTAAPITLSIPTEYAFAGITGATLTGYTMATDDVDGAIKNYATSPAAARVAAAPNAATPAVPFITFTLDAKVAGTYFVWARVKTAADTSNEVWVSPAAGAAFNAFIAPVTGADTWKWAQMFIAAANANAPTANPFTFNVAAPGPIQVRVAQREGAVKINQIVVTTKPDFNGDQFTRTFMDITVPLKVAGAPDAKIVATVWENTTEEGKRSLGVKELKIVSSVPLHVKGIYPLINGIYSSSHGTYTLVDTVAGGPDLTKAVISTGGSTASTWIADVKADKISFAFDVIEVAR